MAILAQEFQEILKKRELFHQATNIKDPKFEIKTLYCGFDATAPSLQIGNLLCISFLRLAALHGINIIALLGGATTKVGDPTGKNEARKKLEEDAIENNIKMFESQIRKLLPNAKILNNDSWLSDWKFMDFLNNTAGNFSLSSLLKLKTFSTRLDANMPLSLQEFMYPIMQAYDFLWLYENQGCNAQCGGADQWCNILTGVELAHNKYGKKIGNDCVCENENNENASNNPNSEGNSNENAHDDETKVIGITLPLLLNSQGQKMGKSVKGAVYLCDDNSSIFDFWQFWRNIEDSMVIPCLKKFTLIDLDEIEKIAALPNINDAKIILANDVTSWIHGKEAAENAYEQAKLIFVERNVDDFEKVIVDTSKLVEIMVKTGAVKSNSEAKSLIEQNAVKINDIVVNNKDHVENASEFALSIGKKKFFKIIKNI